MAAQTSQHTYSVEDMNLTRLSCIHQKVTTKVLRCVFRNGSSDRPYNKSLLDYYSEKGINSTRFRNRLFEEQRTKVDNDFQGDTFDITLLYRCLRCGSHGLAQENDEKWNRDDRASIESLLTIVKNRRNHLAHEQPKFTSLQLLSEAQDLKDELKQILQYSEHLFNIPTATINQEISDVEDEITKYLYDEFQPTTFEEYKNQLFFDAQSEYVKDEGVKDTMRQYDACLENEISPRNQVVDLSLPVDSVYTEMKLKGNSQSDQDNHIKYEDVLKEGSQKRTGSVTVVSGPVGAGKTTFTKRMIRDFKLDINTMTYLTEHDHLFKSECRNPAIKSFSELLHQLMPNVSKHFKAGDLEKVVLSQKLLVILDGMDELNKASSQLFEELLYLTKKFGITLVITTRPEKMEDLKQKLKYHNLKMKVIEILGVPKEKREELVRKYHTQIAKKHPGIQDISGLLKYLKATELRLEDLWRIPYNLILLTIIWSYDFKDVTSINTAPELYREILQLYRIRLKERLQSHEATQHLNGSQLDKVIDFFLYNLARESLIGLVNNQINLPQEAYERLEDVCDCLKIPTEEMISAFLRRIPSTDIIYGFPHKGLQDYLAAYYIWLEITRIYHNHDVQDILDGVTEFFLQKNVSSTVIRKTVTFLKEELKEKPVKRGTFVTAAAGTLGHMFPSFKTSSFIHSILKDIHGFSNYDLSKLQNMFISLLGMFYSENYVIDENIKLEALMLLQRTGVRDRDGWITILNSVKCDNFVALYISRQPQILEGHIQITDSSVSAYVSLMKALKPPLKNAHKVKVDVDVKGDLTDAHELLELISSHQFKVLSISINGSNSQEYVAMLKALITPLHEAKKVKVDMTDIELLNSIELMDLIEKNNLTVRILQVKDFEIGDSNLQEYISVLKSPPRILESANQMEIYINVKRDLTGAEELLELVSSHTFRVKTILINEINFMTYTTMMRALTKQLYGAHSVKVDVCIDEDNTAITELMREIKRNKFNIGKFKVKDIQITDENFMEYTDLLKDLPHSLKDAHEVRVDICIDKDMTTITGLLREIERCDFSIGMFKVRNIQITNDNFQEYAALLETMPISLKYAHEVRVDICIDEDITTTGELMRTLNTANFSIGEFKVKNTQITDENFRQYTDLLKYLPTPIKETHKKYLVNHIRDKGIGISVLKLKDKTLKIDDDTISVYTEALRSLPMLAREEDRGKIDIAIRRETSDVNTFLEEIARNQFPAYISLVHDFQHHESPSVTEEDLNNAFARCSIERYMGRIWPHLSIPVAMKHLWLSVADTPSYLQLLRFLDTDHQLTDLRISINITHVEAEKMMPLPEVGLGPSLFLPDIGLNKKEDLRKGPDMLKRLNPINGHMKFFRIYFPRLRLKGEEIKSLLSQMKGINIRSSVVIPSICRPSSEYLSHELEQLAMETLHGGEGIEWGRPYGFDVGSTCDMDSW